MAMNSAILLAEENRQLRAVNAKQVKKRAKRRTYIASGGTLTIQEGLELINPTTEPVVEAVGGVDGIETTEPVVRPRVPRKCSICRSESHTANKFPA
jgi:hypothetical protein